MVFKLFCTVAMAIAGVVAAAAPAASQVAMAGGMIPGAGITRVPVTSLNDLKFQNIVRQRTDYSCGAAAVATILQYAYGVPSTEESVIAGMLAVSDADVVRHRGFSMLDMKHYVESLGYSGAGYKLPIEALYQVKVPIVVLVNVQGYDHFVVMKKATPTYIYVADPILGNRVVPTSEFVQTWNGIMFVIAAPSYDSDNVLLALNVPVPFDKLTQTVPGTAQVLSSAELMSIYIPSMTRL